MTAPTDAREPGWLILVGSGDASPRVREVLATAEVVTAEVVTAEVVTAEVVAAEVVTAEDTGAGPGTAELIGAVRAGATVAVVTEAATPGRSAAGYRLVRAAVEADVPVTAVPGPSAVTTAIALCGLPSDRFCVEGFPSESAAERRALFAALATDERTLVFFEAADRLAATLADLATALGGQRRAALSQGQAATQQEVRRGALAELAASVHVAASAAASATGLAVRGAVVLVVAGAPAGRREAGADRPGDAEILAAVAAREAAGTSRRDAIVEVARALAVPKREVYGLVVGARSGSPRG